MIPHKLANAIMATRAFVLSLPILVAYSFVAYEDQEQYKISGDFVTNLTRVFFDNNKNSAQLSICPGCFNDINYKKRFLCEDIKTFSVLKMSIRLFKSLQV